MPSRHSSSSHSSHSSHHSSSHHSSSRSYHSSSSHSSRSYSSGGSSYHSYTTRSRSNQPKGYKGPASKIYRCKNHDYVFYATSWVDAGSGREYQTGYYDENGNYYRDIVFSQQGKILDNATAVVRCDYCGTEDSRPWADREKPCEHCGGNVTVVSQVDELENTGTWITSSGNAGKGCLIAVLIMILLPFVIGIFGCTAGAIYRAVRGPFYNYSQERFSDYSYESEAEPYTDSGTYGNTNKLGNTLYLNGANGTYFITTKEVYQANYQDGGYKRLVLDSDGNYYDKETEGYAYLNEDIDPAQFQYWFEGISSEYGDYGWMEYDTDEGRWYIEVEASEWEPLDNSIYEANKDRLWHIYYVP
ncbi:MAG: hypothetical protein J5537_01645 [Lachnospiraceae bacterium]|nr:hypothetical protein [Lachnospiraceae bacterium]